LVGESPLEDMLEVLRTVVEMEGRERGSVEEGGGAGVEVKAFGSGRRFVPYMYELESVLKVG
jgi:hypothetical protein